MKRSAQIWKLSLLCVGLMALGGAATAPVLAQSVASPGTDPNANQDLNSLFNSRDQSASSLFGVINRLQLLNGRNPADFASEQNENFQSAVDEFRKKQRQIQDPGGLPPASSTRPSKLP